MALVSVLLLLVFLPLAFLFFLRPSHKNLPPGPFAWPLVGTLLPKLKKQPHVELTNLARTYGPLMLLKFGVEPVIMASTHAAAMEVLKNQDRVLSGRFAPNSTRIQGYIEHSMVWSDCTHYWKMMRRICRTELFSTKMLDAQAHVREEKVSELIRFFRGKEGEVVNFADAIFGAILNVLGALIFSQDVYDIYEESNNSLGMKGMIRQLMILAAIPNLADLYPILGGSDFQGLRKASAVCVKKMNGSWADIVKDRRAENEHSKKKNDFLQVLIDAGFNDAHIDAMLLETFGPGSDTSTSTIEWAMAELLRNPTKHQKVRQELEKVIGSTTIKESDLPHLPYLHACIKETLRLHPPVTFLLPHRAMETCQVMGSTIPKDCQLMVNTYAIGRDPTTWADPISFEPERFLDSDVDYQGNDFHYVPFGAGRRICPGLLLATRVVRLVLGSLIQALEWKLPEGMDPNQLDMTDRFGLALQKDVPLLVVPTRPKSSAMSCN